MSPGPEGSVILLYETSLRKGHWTCVFVTPRDTLEVFDSYGVEPDAELGFISPAYKRESNQVHTHLIRLLLKDGRQVEYNPAKLQRLSNEISTCGRHVSCRLACRDMPIEEYVEMMRSIASVSPDKMVLFAVPKIDL